MPYGEIHLGQHLAEIYTFVVLHQQVITWTSDELWSKMSWYSHKNYFTGSAHELNPLYVLGQPHIAGVKELLLNNLNLASWNMLKYHNSKSQGFSNQKNNIDL